MSVRVIVHVSCDRPQCPARYQHLAAETAKAAGVARAKGWLRVGAGDWCPKHATPNNSRKR